MKRMIVVSRLAGVVVSLALLGCTEENTGPGPLPSTVEAGPDQVTSVGASVTLDASASCTGGLTCTWRQLAGADVTGGSGSLTGQLAEFRAPTDVTTLQFELRVGNGADWSAPDTMTVMVLEDQFHALFVSPAGHDTNPGTPEAPMRSLANAIQRAASAGSGTDLYAAEGTYLGSLRLVTGVSLYGGFSTHGWLRDPTTFQTTIAGGQLAVVADGVEDLTVDGFIIRSADGIAHGGVETRSSIGVLVVNTRNLLLARNRIEAGAGASGSDGLAGWPGRDALPGAQGREGDQDNNVQEDRPGGVGGAGWPHVGGSGGRGTYGSQNGDAGSAGEGGSFAGAGGAGGGWGDPSGEGSVGAGGQAGAQGMAGAAGAAFGEVHPVFGYLSSNGASGLVGGPGGGGGGGGGSGGQDDWHIAAAYRGTGNSGGGGGGGGAGGYGGSGGLGGGASLGVLLIDAVGTQLLDNAVETAGGGNGGRSGIGGEGGNGGSGGPERIYQSGEIGKGGAGGRGGEGGVGGAGGGGGGGPSIGIVESAGSTSTRRGNTFQTGPAGKGGTSSDPAALGADGATGDYLKLP